MAAPQKSATDKVAARGFAKRLQALPDAYLECRDMRHAWYISHDFHVAPDTIEGGRVVLLDRVLSCERCPGKRTQHFKQGRYGLEKLGETRYSPSSYRIPGVPPGVRTQIIVQQESYRRSLEKAVGAKKGQRATAER